VPRVVPSQVVALIDQMFPWAATQPDDIAHRIQLELGHSPALEALITLTDQIPAELLPSDANDYRQFVASVAAIRNSIEIWIARGGVHPLAILPGYGYLNPVTLIRRALLDLPDEAPAPSTVALTYITDQPLRESIRLDMSAAHHDLAQGEWKGATVLAGSEVEALLLWALREHESRHPGALAAAGLALVQAGVLGAAPHADPAQWDLHQYIEVAAQLGKVTQDTAQLVRLSRRFRNLIHPGRAQRLAQKCDRATALGALAAVEAVTRDLTP
jgi:hypothetical protein